MRVCRNKKTGRSKHYAFMEFADEHVASIAARTMDSYLLFGHVLQVKVVPAGQVHPELFKHANRRFKPLPMNKMVGKHLDRALGETKWAGRVAKEEQRRAKRAAVLDEMDYAWEAPALKAPVAIPLPVVEKAVVAVEDQEEAQTIVEAEAVVEEKVVEEKIEEKVVEEKVVEDKVVEDKVVEEIKVVETKKKTTAEKKEKKPATISAPKTRAKKAGKAKK